MSKNFLKTFLVTLTMVMGFFSVNPTKTEADDCLVLSAQFRVVGEDGSPIQISETNWYDDSPSPYVYIDFTSLGCIGQSFQLSITEYDAVEDSVAYFGEDFTNNVFEGLAIVDMGDDDDVVNFDNLTITNINADNFSYAVRAGDDECEDPIMVNAPSNCRYYLRVNDEVLEGDEFTLTPNLRYDCDNDCDDKYWHMVGQLQEYLGTHPNDPALVANQTPPDPNANSGDVGITTINANIQNPIGENDMTLVDFIDKVLKFALTVGIPIVAIAIIYSGLLFVTARGNDAQLETAKNAFTYAVIGGAILLGCWIFAKLIRDTINSIAMITTYFGHFL